MRTDSTNDLIARLFTLTTGEDDPVARLLRILPPLELLRVAPMDEAERLSSLSEDTILREHPEIVVKLSKRRNGVRVLHALMLNTNTA
jgi:hypothetical protein